MFEITGFEKQHIEEAKKLALMNYHEERAIVCELPEVGDVPGLEYFANNGLGVVMYDGGKLLGFLCCNPWENAFNTGAKGAFSPIHAHGAAAMDRGVIYQKMYRAAAKKWVGNGIAYHAVALYAHDTQAVNAFFQYGFGLRCMDAVRSMANIECASTCDGIFFVELKKDEAIQIRKMRKLLATHMAESPCFMGTPSDWLNRVEKRDSRLFVATVEKIPVAYVEVMENGENFATETVGMKNICGAFCEPDHRGKGVMRGLLNHVVSELRSQGVSRLGVDFESFNPEARGFWLKYFTAYTNSVARRIDVARTY